MSKTTDKVQFRQLQTLERWRANQLEEAKTQHAEVAKIAEDKRAVVVNVETAITDNHTFAREQVLGGAPLSAQSMQRLNEFTALKIDELAHANDAFDQSRQQVDAAQQVVVKQFESLRVVERLRDRRDYENAREALRISQKQLDEQGLCRAAGPADGSYLARFKE